MNQYKLNSCVSMCIGFAFLLYTREESVHRLMSACTVEDSKFYFFLSSISTKNKKVCVCVCVCVCMQGHVRVRPRVCTWACSHVCMCFTCVYKHNVFYMCVYMYTYACVHVCVQYVFCIHVCMHTCMQICMCMGVYVGVAVYKHHTQHNTQHCAYNVINIMTFSHYTFQSTTMSGPGKNVVLATQRCFPE